ncbi:hypothetical protein CPB86DRAFT_269362 [Serendipita vermifera]|nr:hypothetical protein CPB86DRAFT_269362 [Serendipita vermifera]
MGEPTEQDANFPPHPVPLQFYPSNESLQWFEGQPLANSYLNTYATVEPPAVEPTPGPLSSQATSLTSISPHLTYSPPSSSSTSHRRDADKPYKCTGCPKMYERKHLADACQNRHLGLKPIKCTGSCGDKNCTRTFAGKKEYNRHSHPKEERVFKCPSCSKEISKQNLAAHTKKHCKERKEPSI